MKTPSINTLIAVAIASLSMTVTAVAKTSDTSLPPEDSAPRVQLALLLDTSGSMQGLIDQARTQIWQVVNTFITARQNGKTPVVEVALYEYGHSNLDGNTHYIRQLQPLTRDLDAVSESLFSLSTNGGEEYCGAVIREATNAIQWDASPDTYKAIFIAGNEPFTQGPISPDAACREAIAKGIIVNTIHCGSEAGGISTGWKQGALLADGRYLIIDHNQAVISIDAPQDAEIAKLNDDLNKTYVAYGQDGETRRARQIAQDVLAASAAPASKLERAATKASANYANEDWDLVDAVRKNKVDLAKIEKTNLPADLREIPTEQLAEVIEQKNQKRAEIQKQILALSKDREAFIAQEKQKTAHSGTNTLDSAMITAVHEQAEKKGIVFNQK